jgi:hypothetical protein
MFQTPDSQLILFFVATSMAIVSSHIGLVRLIVNMDVTRKDAEKHGVLIVVQFALIALIGAPLPIAAQMIDPTNANPFHHPAWIVPVTVLIFAGLDLGLARLMKQTIDAYYFVVWLAVVVLNLLIWLWPHLLGLDDKLRFYLAMLIVLFILASQFLKSALRMIGYIQS